MDLSIWRTGAGIITDAVLISKPAKAEEGRYKALANSVVAMIVVLIIALASNDSRSEEVLLVESDSDLYSALKLSESGASSKSELLTLYNSIGYVDATESTYRLSHKCGGQLPAGVTRQQLYLVIKNYLEKNPNEWGGMPWFTIYQALSETWPCREDAASSKTIDTPVVKAIKNNPFLSYWQRTNPELWGKATEIDEEFKLLKEFDGRSLDERFSEVVKQVLSNLQAELRSAYDKNDKVEADRLWALMEEAYP